MKGMYSFYEGETVLVKYFKGRLKIRVETNPTLYILYIGV